eukprot:scaffold22646_cov68-Phaeocystis_antarctica.AAC.7
MSGPKWKEWSRAIVVESALRAASSASTFACEPSAHLKATMWRRGLDGAYGESGRGFRSGEAGSDGEAADGCSWKRELRLYSSVTVEVLAEGVARPSAASMFLMPKPTLKSGASALIRVLRAPAPHGVCSILNCMRAISSPGASSGLISSLTTST